MKITSIDNYIKRHPGSHSMFRGEGEGREQMSRSVLPSSNQEISLTAIKLQQNNSVKKTALTVSGFFNGKNTPSFGCAQKEMGKVANWIADSKVAHCFLKLAGNNPAVFESVSALVVAGALRPLTIMSLPANAEDKKKNKKAAAHSISSGLIGLGMAILLFNPITAALKKLEDTPEKFGISKTGKMYEQLNGVVKRKTIYQNFWKNAPKMLFAPVTAGLTIALIPVIDKYVLGRMLKPSEAKAEMTPMDVYRSTSFKSGINSKANKTYKSFMGGQV